MCLHKLQVQELYQEIVEERYKGINIDQKVKSFPIECFTLSRRGYASEDTSRGSRPRENLTMGPYTRGRPRIYSQPRQQCT